MREEVSGIMDGMAVMSVVSQARHLSMDNTSPRRETKARKQSPLLSLLGGSSLLRSSLRIQWHCLHQGAVGLRINKP